MKSISQRELLAYQADVKGSIFRQIRQVFSRLKEKGFTQKELAARIGMDEGQLSRRIRGDFDLKLETLSDLARGLECRIDVRLTPLSEINPWQATQLPRVPQNNSIESQNRSGIGDSRKPFEEGQRRPPRPLEDALNAKLAPSQ
jgi:transcriptional regulator with XRE-family HTH domain